MWRSWGQQVILRPPPLITNSMAQRSTRNKIRFQADAAHDDLYKAQTHLTQMAALADERSDFINEWLPDMIASVDATLGALTIVREKL